MTKVITDAEAAKLIQDGIVQHQLPTLIIIHLH